MDEFVSICETASLLLIATGGKLKNVREREAIARMISQSDLQGEGGDCMTSAACLKARRRRAEAGRKVSFFEGPQARAYPSRVRAAF